MAETCTKCGGKDFTDGGKCRGCQRERNAAYRAKQLAKAAGGG
jgi:hypothetical protein